MARKRNAAKVNAVTTGEAPWGNIETNVLSKPPENVSADASWASVIGMWLLLPLNILQAIFGALLPIVYRNYSWWAAQSVGCGRPFLLAWTWWRYVLTGLLALLLPCTGGGSRLRLFRWEWAAFGKGEYWYHGEGVWAWTYAMVDAIQKGSQARKAAFGCIAAAIPDLFPKGILIFLPNSGKSPEAEASPAAEEKNEWWWMRQEFHKIFFAGNPGYYERLQNIGPYLKKNGVVRDRSKLDDKEYLNGLVVQCVMYVIFDAYAEGGTIGSTGLDRSEPANWDHAEYEPIWLSPDEVSQMVNWRGYAAYWVLPRLLQRFLFNFLIGRVKGLRKDSADLVDRHRLRAPFEKMNSQLPVQYRSEYGVELMDKVFFIFGFAGIGGTSAGVESTGQFLQGKTGEIGDGLVTFPPGYDGLAMWKDGDSSTRHNFIREVCRLDPPVTSATTSFVAEKTILLYNGVGCPNACGGNKETTFPEGTLNQYTLSMANRDPATFAEPQTFNPSREELDKALTWNGAFKSTAPGPEPDALAAQYPRICPGRKLSIYIIEAIINALILEDAPTAP